MMEYGITAAAILCLLLPCGPARCQGSDQGGSSDLRLLKAQLTLEAARLEFESASRGAEAGLVPAIEAQRMKARYDAAKLDYLDALTSSGWGLGGLFITSAKKSRDKEGRIDVTLAVRYRSMIPAGVLGTTVGSAGPLEMAAQRFEIRVSLLSEGVIISEPYQVSLAPLSDGETKRVSFALLKDVDVIEVSLRQAGGEKITKVQLQKDSDGRAVTISSAEVSQEADLGGTAVYQMTLERFTRNSSTFRLRTQGLPREIAHEFLDPASNARLTQINFQEGITSKKLQLKLHLPDTPSTQVLQDQSITFRVLCTDGRLEGVDRTEQAGDGVQEGPMGSIELEVVPRGTPKLTLDVLNLYREIQVGETASVSAKIVNGGTRRLDNIRVSVDVPLNWSKRIDPDRFQVLDQSRDASLQISCVPPADVAVGDYELRVRAECLTSGRRIEADEKIVRVHVGSKGRMWSMAILVLAILGMLFGMILLGIRLTRR